MKNVCRFDKKYFPNIRNGICPICSGILEDIDIDEWEYTRDNTFDADNNDFNDDFNNDFNDDFNSDFENKHDITVPLSVPIDSERQTGLININGIILDHNISYDNRHIIEKFFDGIIHRQSYSDTLHTFLIQNQENNSVYNITAYGTISGRGAGIIEGQHAFIRGRRTRNGIIFCERMQVNSGGMMADVIFYNGDDPHMPGGYNSPRPAYRNRAFFNFILVLIVALLVIIAFNFIPVFKEFIALWIAMSIIVICIFFKRMHASTMFIIGAGLVLAILVNNIGGIGTLVLANLSAIAVPALTIGLMILGIIFIISSVFKK